MAVLPKIIIKKKKAGERVFGWMLSRMGLVELDYLVFA